MVWTTQNLLLSIVIIVILVVWYLSYLWRRRNLYIHSWNIPGPLALPFLGIAYKFFGNPDDILDKIIKIIEEHPSPVKAWMGSRLLFAVTDPQHIEKILTNQKCLAKDGLYKFVADVLGMGLFTAPTPLWKRHRKAIMPAFNQRILNSFVEIFSEQSAIFVEGLQKYVGRRDIDISEPVLALTMDLICETAMGLKMNTQQGNNTFSRDLERLFEIATIRMFRVWHHLLWTWKLYPLSREFAERSKSFHIVTSQVIKAKMQSKESGKNTVEAEIEEGSSKKRMPFLDLILENSDFTEEELRDEVEIFLAAGTDTSSITMCFILEMLGLYPEVQEKVYNEIIDVIGENRSVESSDLPKFSYTERVIKETLRLFPIAVYFARNIGEDIDLGKYILPKGSGAFFSTLNIHRNPKFWPDPLKFDPDRFLPEEIAKRHPCTFIPFSYGPRNCIGARYAMMSLQTIIATTIRKYRIFTSYKSIEELELKTKVLARPKHGFKVYLELR